MTLDLNDIRAITVSFPVHGAGRYGISADRVSRKREIASIADRRVGANFCPIDGSGRR
jgi:hypothetical protein